jgi:hypothetical protein
MEDKKPMPEFRIVRRTDVPANDKMPKLAQPPHARLHSGGTLFLNVLATEVISDSDCGILVEYDDQANTLKLSNPEKLPRGVSESDCFPMRVRCGKKQRRATGMISMKRLLRHIGYQINGACDFPVKHVDKENRSITVEVPNVDQPAGEIIGALAAS